MFKYFKFIYKGADISVRAQKGIWITTSIYKDVYRESRFEKQSKSIKEMMNMIDKAVLK